MKATDLDILIQEGEGVMLEYKEGLSAIPMISTRTNSTSG